MSPTTGDSGGDESGAASLLARARIRECEREYERERVCVCEADN